MKYKTFKDFLKSKYLDQYIGDANYVMNDFRDWLRCMVCPDTDNIVKYADEYAAIQRQEIVEEIEKFFKKKGWESGMLYEELKQTLTN